jgi:hypothetical protein
VLPPALPLLLPRPLLLLLLLRLLFFLLFPLLWLLVLLFFMRVLVSRTATMVRMGLVTVVVRALRPVFMVLVLVCEESARA